MTAVDYLPNGSVKVDGVLIVEFNDQARLFTRRETDGTVTEGPRAYTEAENAGADVRLAEEAARAQYETRRVAIKAIVTDLQAEKARMDIIQAKTPSQITGGDTKNTAQAITRVADAAIELARFVQNQPYVPPQTQ